MDVKGRFFEVDLPGGGQAYGRVHRIAGRQNATPFTPIILTLPFWIGCPFQYYPEVLLLATALRQLPRFAGRLVQVHKGVRTAQGNDVLGRRMALQGITVSPEVPMCCSGSYLDGSHGHSMDSPCRRLLQSSDVQLVRMGRPMPTLQHTSACARDIQCPIGDGGWLSGYVHETSVTNQVVHIAYWRAILLRLNRGESADWLRQTRHEWPGDFIAPARQSLMAIAAGNTCMAIAALRLPEAVALTHISLPGAEPSWGSLLDALTKCYRFFGWIFVEYEVDVAAAFVREGIDPKLWRAKVPVGKLIVRACTPSAVDIYGYSPSTHPRCTTDAVGKYVIPTHLAYILDAVQAFSQLRRDALNVEPLSVPFVDRRWRDPISSRNEVVAHYYDYHTHLSARYQTHLVKAKIAEVSDQPAEGGSTSLYAAICILGLARTFDRPEVYESIRVNVSESLGVKVQFFHLWELEHDRSLANLTVALSALSPAEPWSEWNGHLRRPVRNLTCATPTAPVMYTEFRRCLWEVESFERQRHMKFDWIIRLRTDATWLAPIGPLATYSPDHVHLASVELPERSLRFGLHDDRFALVPRRFARAYFAVIEEPALCARAKFRMKTTMLCQAYNERVGVECLLDLRLTRLEVPVKHFTKIFEIVRP